MSEGDLIERRERSKIELTSMANSPLYISSEEVKTLASIGDLVKASGEALTQFSAGEEGGVVQPVRACIPIKDHGG